MRAVGLGRSNWSNAGSEGGVAEQGFRSVRWASRFIVVSTDTLRAPERRDGAQGCARDRVRHPTSGCGDWAALRNLESNLS